VEPAPVLIAPLKIQLCRPVLVRPRLQHRCLTDPGIEPDIQDIVLLGKPRAAAMGTAGAGRKQLLGALQEPDIRPFAFHEIRYPFHEVSFDEGGAAPLAVEDGNGHPPGPLA
jgi:hypothetical protein